MYGSDPDRWSDDVVATPQRAEGARLLLDDFVAERERAQMPPAPAPVLTVDPVPVPPAGEVSRREARQRLAELENAARRNLRSAEEARRLLLEEHQRLSEEAFARSRAQQEAGALRRELDRLRESESQRVASEQSKAERAARERVADEIKRFHEQHAQVVHELDQVRGALSDHDGLLDEYASRLREEQQARAALRAEVERAEAARRLAERGLEAATENARRRAEDELIRLATTEQQLADVQSDRDRLAAKLADLNAGDGPLGRMSAEIEDKDAQIARLNVRVADLAARIDAAEDAAQSALADRESARSALVQIEERFGDAEQARLDGELAVDVASARLGELEAEMETRVAEAEARVRDAERLQGRLRREAVDASKAHAAAESARQALEAERDELDAQVTDLQDELARVRDHDEHLRAHAATVGEELIAVRATLTALQTAAELAPPPPVDPDRAFDDALDRALDGAFEEPGVAADPGSPVPAFVPPLPVRVAARAERPPLER
ncbi:MAG TPA: hypothetical protein VN636_03870, partial [Acidimicrobiia bacterium]|nr:hypothetical protein [Acidimicrobiia bacterium]